VCTVTDWTTEESEFDSRQRQESVPFSIMSRPALGPIQRSIQWLPRGIVSLNVRSRRQEADHLPPSNAEVKNGGGMSPPHNTSSWRGA
jgi:hypothetical protein